MSEALSWEELRRQVAARARGCCEYCRSQVAFSPDPFAVDHITPSSRGGPDSLENLAYACLGCNGHKPDREDAVDPVTELRVPLYHPRRQRWRDHFSWSADFTRIVGISPSGRATVLALQLNRDGLVNLRRVLRMSNEHPPAEDPVGTPAPTTNGASPEPPASV